MANDVLAKALAFVQSHQEVVIAVAVAVLLLVLIIA